MRDMSIVDACQDGLTLREWATLQFMCAIVNNPGTNLADIKENKVANQATKLANAFFNEF